MGHGTGIQGSKPQLEVEAVRADREIAGTVGEPHQCGELSTPNGLRAPDALLGQNAQAVGPRASHGPPGSAEQGVGGMKATAVRVGPASDVLRRRKLDMGLGEAPRRKQLRARRKEAGDKGAGR